MRRVNSGYVGTLESAIFHGLIPAREYSSLLHSSPYLRIFTPPSIVPLFCSLYRLDFLDYDHSNLRTVKLIAFYYIIIMH